MSAIEERVDRVAEIGGTLCLDVRRVSFGGEAKAIHVEVSLRVLVLGQRVGVDRAVSALDAERRRDGRAVSSTLDDASLAMRDELVRLGQRALRMGQDGAEHGPGLVP